MKQRPLFCLALLVFLILLFLPARLFYEPLQVKQKCEAQVTGRVGRRVIKNEKTQIYLKDCRVESRGNNFSTGQLLVYLSDTTTYPVGTDLSLSGTLYPIEEPTNPGQFNSRLYYQGKGISYTFYAEKVFVCSLHPSFIKEKLMLAKEKIARVYEYAMDERDSALLQSMVLGMRENLDEDTKEFYQRNGIAHLLAISGLHISLVGMGLYQILKKASGVCVLPGIISVAFLWAYGWMTGASISAMRAVIMCSLAILADLIGRTYDMLTAIGAAALILMSVNPLSAKQSAFLLSFGAVFAIALFQQVWKLYLSKTKKFSQAVCTSLSVLYFTCPLQLCFFYAYPLYSFILNLLVIPLMSIVMICGIACGLTGLIFLPIARICGFFCHWILSLYDLAGQRCLSLPGSVLTLGAPAIWKVVLYYGILSVGLYWIYCEKRRKKYWRKKEPFQPERRRLAAGAGLVLAGMFLLCLRVHTGFRITMLDVGQGDAVFFRSPSGMTFLSDAGSTSVKKVGTYRILPFLQWEGTGVLDYIFVSHMDEDHINGLRELIEDSLTPGGIQIGHAVLPALASKDDAYIEMEELLTGAEIEILYMGQGDCLSDDQVSFTCLWPPKETRLSDRNDLSLVFLAEYGQFDMLFTGDIEKETEAKLAALGILEEVEILKVAHHGSRHSSSEVFLRKVRPSLSLISCSATNRYGHPGEETLARLKEEKSVIKITKDSGAVRIFTDGKRVKVKGTMDGG